MVTARALAIGLARHSFRKSIPGLVPAVIIARPDLAYRNQHFSHGRAAIVDLPERSSRLEVKLRVVRKEFERWRIANRRSACSLRACVSRLYSACEPCALV